MSNETVIRPSGHAIETRLVLLVALLTIAICGASIVLRNVSGTTSSLFDWQVDAFMHLRPGELSIFNALYTAAPEIELYHAEKNDGWPSVAELAAGYVAPFVHDVSWKKNGAMDWSFHTLNAQDKHIAVYVGHPATPGVFGSFLLVMLHDHVKKEGNAGGAVHAPYEIWIHSSPKAEPPVMVTDQALINKGWREVVARKGDGEARRTKKDFVE